MPSVASTALPEFKVAEASEWPGDPDFDPVDVLLSMPQFADATIWAAQAAEPEELSSVAHLAARVSALDDNRFGVAKRRVGSHLRFAQTLRVGDAWIVEVHDGTDADWASRVLHSRRSAQPGTLDPAESWPSDGAADVMWSWLQGSLPADLRRERLR